METFIITIFDGLALGSIYALIALGYTMVYGIAKMLNFAHGDVIMVGAYTAFTCVMSLNFSPLVAVLMCIAVCVILGISIEFLAYRPLRQAPSLSVLITAIGVSYFLQNISQLFFGTEQKTFPTDFVEINPIVIGGISISGITIFTLITTGLLMIGLTFFINKTKLGKAMRATSEDRQAAEFMGISVNKTITWTFAIGSLLAAIASIFFGITYPKITPTIGSMPGIKAFTAAVFGGIGSIPGAMLGGILLGIIEKLASAYISNKLSNSIVFGVLILVLVIKPTGLLGKKIKEKV